jgi:hypothetical protein
MPSIWIDTNSFPKTEELRDLARRGSQHDIQFRVHAQVYLELQRQALVRNPAGPGFHSLFQQLGVKFVSLDQQLCGLSAGLLAKRFPSDERWQEAKYESIGGELHEQFRHRPSRMSMTTDWLIVSAVEASEDSWIVTAERDREWKALARLRRILDWDDVKHWLETGQRPHSTPRSRPQKQASRHPPRGTKK